MQKENKKKKVGKNNIESLLPRTDVSKLRLVKDVITHVNEQSLLSIFGVDSLELAHSFVELIKEHSPIEVNRIEIETKEMAFDLLKNPEKLNPNVVNVVCFYDKNDILPLNDVSDHLLFYRDYIPQFQLKLVLIVSHPLMTTIMQRGYDFYSVSGFSSFFTDISYAARKDFEKPEGKPRPVIEYEKKINDLNHYREETEIIPHVLMRKLLNAGVSALKISKNDEALKLFEEILQYALQFDEKQYQARAYDNIGSIYREKGKYEEALEKHKMANDLFKEVRDLAGEGNSLINMALTFYEKSDVEDALRTGEAALKIAKITGDYQAESRVLNIIENIHFDRGDIDKARECNKTIIGLAEKTGDSEMNSLYLGNLANISINEGFIDEALKYSRKALKIAQRICNPKIEIQHLDRLGNIFFQSKDYDIALKYFTEALNIAKNIGNPVLEAKYLELVNSPSILRSK